MIPMKKPVKILVIVLAVIMALLAALVVGIGAFGGSLVKKAVVMAGSSALKVPVTLSDADLSILGGKVAMRGLEIDNPPGYQHDKLLKLKEGFVEVQVGSLLSDTVRIRQIRLDGMDLVLEQKGLSSNLQDLIHNLPKSDVPKDKEPAGKKLWIDVLEIRNVKVEAKLLPIPGKADTIPLKLSTIRMTDLGRDGTMDTAALTGRILLAIAGGIVEQGSGLLPKDLIGGMGSALGKTAEVGKQVLKGAGDVGKGIGKGLQGLFKGAKK
jgi:hypothetical protein